MRLPRPAQHVIFDLDGILLDTERLYTEVTQAIVGRYGKTFDWTLKGNMVGRPAIESARYLVEALDLPISAEDYLREREHLLRERFARAEPCAGARELTHALAARGARQAIATSSGRALFELKTKRHRDWLRVFAAVVLGDDPRLARGKPAPDIFLLAAGDLGVEPEACVVLEDSPVGVAAAHAAGMQAVAVPDPAMDRTRFAGAELLIASLAELTPEDLGVAARTSTPS
jgi:pseudouridine-5'-monophosphatase